MSTSKKCLTLIHSITRMIDYCENKLTRFLLTGFKWKTPSKSARFASQPTVSVLVSFLSLSGTINVHFTTDFFKRQQNVLRNTSSGWRLLKLRIPGNDCHSTTVARRKLSCARSSGRSRRMCQGQLAPSKTLNSKCQCSRVKIPSSTYCSSMRSMTRPSATPKEWTFSLRSSS